MPKPGKPSWAETTGSSSCRTKRCRGKAQADALKRMHLFAETVLPEVKSWDAEVSIDDRFLEAAE